jgi:hypothetical protein
MTCLNDFPNICKNDPMINFDVPQSIGFGIARGTACCLYSGEAILDYSGHLLNLASRLNDLARPSGMVIDGGFLKQMIPESSRRLFKEQEVFVRSIAEAAPISVFYLDKIVQISDSALSPLIGENWETETITFTAKQLANLPEILLVDLPTPATSESKIKITLTIPMAGKGVKRGTQHILDFKDFTYLADGPHQEVQLDMDKARARVPNGNIRSVTFTIDYIPKTLPRT